MARTKTPYSNAPAAKVACSRVRVAPSAAFTVCRPRAFWPSDARMVGLVQPQMK